MRRVGTGILWIEDKDIAGHHTKHKIVLRKKDVAIPNNFEQH